MSMGAAIGAAGAAQAIQDISNVGFTFLNKWAYEDTYKKLGKWQNDMNIANWQMENEYNLPKNQMKRLEDAGLNPNLMYGQGSPGNAGSVPSVTGSSTNYGARPGRFDPGTLAQLEQAEALHLKNQGQAIANQRANIQFEQDIRDFNAIETFIKDHSEGYEPWYYVSRFDSKDKRDSYENIETRSRQSPTYKNLEILWKKGEITSEDLSRLKNQVRLSGTAAEWAEDERSMFTGDWSEMSVGEILGIIFKTLLSKFRGVGVSF